MEVTSNVFQQTIAELLLIRASDPRRYTSKLARALAITPAAAARTRQALLNMQESKKEAWMADNHLWAAFVAACDDNAEIMRAALGQALLDTGKPLNSDHLYVIPHVKIWLTK